MAKKAARPRVAQESADVTAERLAALRELIPEAFSEGGLDLEQLRAALGATSDDRPERYSFTWAGKRDAVRLLQVPSRATLIPCSEESVNWDTTQNLFIEGDNLEVLKLLYKSYAGRVKIIYIDPPYNTGNDFIYADNFSDPLDTYLRLTHQKNGNGDLLTSNPETAGRYHSAWLSMMYPRLFLARQMLADDGLIFVSIDDHEVFGLRFLMNEVFGEENFIAQLIWKGRQFPDSRAVSGVSTDHEYVLVYAKSEGIPLRGVARDESKFSNPDDDPRGPWMSRSILGLATREQRPNLHYEIIDPETNHQFSPPPNTGWRYSKERMQLMIAEGRILFPASEGGRPREKKFRADLEREFSSFPSITADVYTSNGTAEIRELFGFQAFDFPKPSELVRRFVEQASSGDDIVMDFFAGSGTTAHAVMTQNRNDGGRRRCISIQLPEPTAADSEVSRMGFRNIAELGKDRIRRVSAKMCKEAKGKLNLDQDDLPEDLGLRVYKLAQSHFRQWSGVDQSDPQAWAKQMDLFVDALLPGWERLNVIYEVALKEGYALTSKVEQLGAKRGKHNTVYRVTDTRNGQSFCICLDDAIDAQVIKMLDLKKDDLYICRDVALTDELAANLALQCRLKTI
jgi:adenine-specific DNA-methyltransferase